MQKIVYFAAIHGILVKFILTTLREKMYYLSHESLIPSKKPQESQP
jgi:hypothetical protein